MPATTSGPDRAEAATPSSTDVSRGNCAGARGHRPGLLRVSGLRRLQEAHEVAQPPWASSPNPDLAAQDGAEGADAVEHQQPHHDRVGGDVGVGRAAPGLLDGDAATVGHEEDALTP